MKVEVSTCTKSSLTVPGLFFSKRCPKGAACNFLHVFKNPGNEFWEADRDFENSSRRDNRDREGTPRWHPQSDRRSQHRRRSRSRSRESSRSQSIRHTHRCVLMNNQNLTLYAASLSWGVCLCVRGCMCVTGILFGGADAYEYQENGYC